MVLAKRDYEMLSDVDLTGLMAARDPAAVRLITQRNNQRLFRTAWAILKNRAEAEDAVQNAYLHAFAAIGDVQNGEATHPTAPKWHAANLARIAKTPNGIDPRETVHAVIIATYNETREILEPTVKAVLDSEFDHKKIIFEAFIKRTW